MKENDFYVLYSHNIAVKGSDKSAIYNLHKGRITFVPGSLIEIIEALRHNSIGGLREQISSDADREQYDKYLQFLERNHLGMFLSNPEQFPPMDKQWMVPYEVMTAVLEYDCKDRKYDLERTLRELDGIGCNFLEIRVFDTDMSFLRKVLEGLSFSGIRSISLLLEYVPDIEQELGDLFDKNEKLECILVFNAPLHPMELHGPNIAFTEASIDDRSLQIDGDEYIINTKYFMEAQEFHPYFNRKVVIDRNGDLKNDLLFNKTFGNVNSSEIKDILESTDYKEIWEACPDRVIEYQGDALRYCRIYTDSLRKVGNLFTVDIP